MSNIQFHFNPVTPVAASSVQIPWKPILIGAGILAILITIAYVMSKPETQEVSSVLDDELVDN